MFLFRPLGVSPVFQGDKFIDDAVNFTLRYSSILLLSYSSVCYSSLSLLNISSCPYIILCGNFFYIVFSDLVLLLLWWQNISGCHHYIPVAHISWHYQQITSVRSNLGLTRSRPWLVLTHIEKGNYLVLHLNTSSSHPVLHRDFHCICPWLKSPIIIQSCLLTSFMAFWTFLFSSTVMFGVR